MCVGDRVQVAAGRYSEVYMFSHRDAHAVGPVVTINSAAGTLRLTHDHYLYVNGKLTVARMVKVGDVVRGVDGDVPVTSVAVEMAEGLFRQIETRDSCANECICRAVQPAHDGR